MKILYDTFSYWKIFVGMAPYFRSRRWLQKLILRIHAINIKRDNFQIYGTCIISVDFTRTSVQCCVRTCEISLLLACMLRVNYVCGLFSPNKCQSMTGGHGLHVGEAYGHIN